MSGNHSRALHSLHLCSLVALFAGFLTLSNSWRVYFFFQRHPPPASLFRISRARRSSEKRQTCTSCCNKKNWKDKMIQGLSKAVTLYLAPVLSLTALLLSLFAYLAPVVMLTGQVALVIVSPSTELVQPGQSSDVDGATIRFGALGESFTHLFGQLHTCIYRSTLILWPPCLFLRLVFSSEQRITIQLHRCFSFTQVR